MVHKNQRIAITVKENRTEPGDQRSIIFARPPGFNYKPGDWIDIALHNDLLKGGKTYSLSSSPTEPDLMITLKDGISEIKQALASIDKGEQVTITQFGNDYSFVLSQHKASTLIAGGVGVAPFRSMLKELIDTGSKSYVHLIYMNKTTDFLFSDEFKEWQIALPNMRITYIATQELQRKARHKTILDAIGSFDQRFYIAGPEAMVETTEHMLLGAGVKLADIKIDSFGGY